MKIHYLIFHPKSNRQVQNVTATSLVNNQIITNWSGNIFVDQIGRSNEDPFVFNNPWLYSFCHASQLRKKPNSLGHIKKGSWLIFVCGQSANNGNLTIDTCFLVDSINYWQHSPLALPKKFQNIHSNLHNILWRRHLRFPFMGQHAKVTHTYESKLWNNQISKFSFLPYESNGIRVSFPITSLSRNLQKKINTKISGKRPVPLTSMEIKQILKKINRLSQIKVLRDIK
jgi:hypothetical protein